MNKRLILAIVAFSMLWFGCKTQQHKEFKAGQKQTENLNYSLAIEHLLNSWEASPSPETARLLAQNYLEVRNFEQAEAWYSRLERDGELVSPDFLPFAEVLIANSKYEEADFLLNQLAEVDSVVEDRNRLEITKKITTEGKALLNSSSTNHVMPLTKLNSSASDFGATLDDKGNLIFASDRIEGQGGKIDPTNALKSEVYGWTGNGFLQVLGAKWNSSEKKPDSAPSQVENLQSRYHIGPVQMGSKMAFITLNKAQKFRKTNSESRARDFTLFPEIYFAEVDDSLTMEDFAPLPFNSPFAYTVSDPHFDEKANRLYFTSDMPGGLGGADIYYAEYLGNSEWSAPVNLGPQINTSGSERSPMIFSEDLMYFSSAGWAGLGGLDVFEATSAGDGSWKLKNLGSPVNSNRDDFGFFVSFKDRNQAFFSSDRAGGSGGDDLFFADLDFRDYMVLKGKVLDSETKEPLPNAVVSLSSGTGQSQNTFISEADGDFSFRVPMNQSISLRGEKTGYLSGVVNGIGIPESAGFADSVVYRDILLDKIQVGKTYQLQNIYYDFDKWDIRPDAEPELLRLAAILKENPTLKIELYSHTDSRGTAAYNLKLSQKRANSVTDFLVGQGINGNRMKGIGFGEEKLINQCKDGVECVEEVHQENRRTEFKIISF